jgi:hypothetical protein
MLFILATVPVWALYCPSCGANAQESYKYCNQCGELLPDSSAANTEAQESKSAVTQNEAGRKILPADPSPSPFQVTSHYLSVRGNRLYKHSLFWISEVKGSSALVWSVDGPPYDKLVMGWVALGELEKRSTLTPEADIYCADPPTINKVIVVERSNFWHHWGPSPYDFSGSIRWHSNHRYRMHPFRRH